MRSDALRTIFTADDRFDDVRRMRIWGRLAQRLPATSAAPRRWPWLVAAGALVAAAVVAFLVHRPADGALHVVPANGVLAMPLGPATRAALVGPGELLVVEAGERTAVELRGGTLYGEFTHAPGRSLRIETNGAVIEVVGTLFSVTATVQTTCVAVAHGRVKFTSRGATTYVEGGQQACAGRATAPSPAHPLDTSTRDALARFDRTWFATSELPAAVAPAPASRVAIETPAAAPMVAPAAAAPMVAPAAAPTAGPTVAPAAGPTVAPTAAPEEATAARARVAQPAPEPRPAAASEPAVAKPVAPAALVTAAPAPASAPAALQPSATATPDAPPSADALYRAADEALARGDAATADRALAELLAQDPDSALADEALYERARLAFARGDWTATRGFVAELATYGSSALREPASYLGCRAALNEHAGDARQCFADYIAAFPSGAHVGDARAHLQRVTP